MKVLIDAGAPVNAATRDGEAYTHYAAASGKTDVVRLLLDAGAPVNAKSKDGTTPLHSAAGNGEPSTVALLLERGARVNARTNSKHTPLRFAVSLSIGDRRRVPDFVGVVKLLIQAGADVNAISLGTILDNCSNVPEIKEILQKAGAKTSAELDQRYAACVHQAGAHCDLPDALKGAIDEKVSFIVVGQVLSRGMDMDVGMDLGLSLDGYEVVRDSWGRMVLVRIEP